MLGQMYVYRHVFFHLCLCQVLTDCHRNKIIPVAPRFIFIVPQIFTWIDISISIGGFVAVKQKEHNQLLPTPYSRAGIAILFVIYLWMAGTFVFIWLRRIGYPNLERSIVNCVATCVPVLAIRITYSLVFISRHDMERGQGRFYGRPDHDNAARSGDRRPHQCHHHAHLATSLREEDGSGQSGSRGSQNVPLV